MSKDNPDSFQLPLFGPIVINLTRGYKTVIDVIDVDLTEYKWHALLSRGLPYAYRRENPSKVISIHRIVMERILGKSLEKGQEVDHIDGDTLNNRRTNLRVCNHFQNTRNAKLRKDSTSGYKGVSYSKQSGRYRAYINVRSKRIYLGHFSTLEEAHSARIKAARKYHRKFARLE